MQQKFWIGDAPTHCDLCHATVPKRFIDGATHHGPWGILCATCHKLAGKGLGQGRGQEYWRQANGKWLKVEG